jgi:hydrogenase maturation protease
VDSGEYRVLVYGYGNPGRQDDGIGVEIATRLEKEAQGIRVDCNYQLNVEDALMLSEFDAVIFVDASLDSGEPFEFRRIEPSMEITFTTHSMSPQSVLALCSELYDKNPDAFVLAVRGYEWDLQEGLTSRAQDNCEKAYEFLERLLAHPSPGVLNEAAIKYDTLNR